MKGALSLTIVILAVLVFGYVSGKGSRGGGSRGGSYRSSSYRSSSYRSYSSSYRSYRARTWSTSQKAAAATIGSIYISRRLRTRYGYGRDWDDDLNVCQNKQNRYASSHTNSSTYGWFLCPTDNLEEEYSHCCGDDDAEYCCTFWSTGGGIGTIVAIVIVGLLGIVVVIWCMLSQSKRKRTRPSNFSDATVSYSNETGTISTKNNDGLPPSYSTTFGQNAPYPTQNPPYPTQNAPYPTQNAPYPTQNPAPVPNSPPPTYSGSADAGGPESKVPPSVYS